MSCLGKHNSENDWLLVGKLTILFSEAYGVWAVLDNWLHFDFVLILVLFSLFLPPPPAFSFSIFFGSWVCSWCEGEPWSIIVSRENEYWHHVCSKAQDSYEFVDSVLSSLLQNLVFLAKEWYGGYTIKIMHNGNR